MSHGGGGHKHHHPLVMGEALIARLFFVVIGFYFLVRVLLAANEQGVLNSLSFTAETFNGIWLAVVDAWLNGLRPIFMIFIYLFVAIWIFATIKVWPLRQVIRVFSAAPAHHGHGDAHGGGHSDAHGAVHPQPKNPAILRHWTAIVRKANTGTPENLRSAVLEADALVDFYLKQAGYKGEHMAERLGQLKDSSVKSLDAVWEAHKLRNELAHTPGFELRAKQAEKALFACRDFLKEMKAF